MEESRQCVDSSWIQTATLMTNSLRSFPMMMARSETSLFPLQLLQDYSQHNQLVKIPYCQ